MKHIHVKLIEDLDGTYMSPRTYDTGDMDSYFWSIQLDPFCKDGWVYTSERYIKEASSRDTFANRAVVWMKGVLQKVAFKKFGGS